MSTEMTSPATDSAGASETQSTGGTTSEPSNSGSFDHSSWDGSRDSLPGEHHQIYDTIVKNVEASRNESEAGRKLQDYLKSQIYQQQQQQPVARQQDNEDGPPLTRQEAMELFKREESDKRQRELVENFRTSMLDTVGKPQRYGDATVAFATEGEVDGFRKFVGETLNGGLTANDMLLLYRQKDIFQQIQDSAVKGFEKKLSNNRPSDAPGGSVETRSSNIPTESGAGERRKGRAPRTAELLQANNPELYQAIVNGKEKLF